MAAAPRGTDMRALMDTEDRAMRVLEDLADALPKTEVVGRLAACSAGDGGAYYICVKAKPLTVAWIPYCDAYRAPAAWIRGLRREDFLP